MQPIVYEQLLGNTEPWDILGDTLGDSCWASSSTRPTGKTCTSSTSSPRSRAVLAGAGCAAGWWADSVGLCGCKLRFVLVFFHLRIMAITPVVVCSSSFGVRRSWLEALEFGLFLLEQLEWHDGKTRLAWLFTNRDSNITDSHSLNTCAPTRAVIMAAYLQAGLRIELTSMICNYPGWTITNCCWWHYFDPLYFEWITMIYYICVIHHGWLIQVIHY